MFGRSLSETMQVEARLGGQFVPILLHRCVNFLRDHGERWWSVTAHGFGMRLGWVVCYRSFGNSLSVGHRLNMNIQSCVLIIMASWSRLWWLTDILYIVTVYSLSVSSGLGFLSVFLIARYQSSFSHLEETCTPSYCTLHHVHVCMDWYMTMITCRSHGGWHIPTTRPGQSYPHTQRDLWLWLPERLLHHGGYSHSGLFAQALPQRAARASHTSRVLWELQASNTMWATVWEISAVHV